MSSGALAVRAGAPSALAGCRAGDDKEVGSGFDFCLRRSGRMQRQLEQHVLAAQPLLLETRLLRAVPYLPLLWTALSVLSLLLRALLRILGSSRRPEERARGLFSTFIQTSDILDVLGAARAGEPEGGLGKGDTLFNRSLVWLSMLGASVALSSGVILSATTRGTWTEVLRSGKMVLAGVGLLAWVRGPSSQVFD